MKQTINIILIILFVGVMLALPFIVADKKVELSEIEKQIEPYINKETQKEQTLNNLYENYNINKSNITSFISYGPISYISVEEITIIKQEDQGKREFIQKKLEQYVAKKITTFESYGPKQVELLKNKIIASKGDYIYLIISEDSIKINQEIEKLF